MSDLMLSTDNDDTDGAPTTLNLTYSSNSTANEEKHDEHIINGSSELLLTENNSIFAILKRICFYWRRILLHRIRLICTFVFMSMINITTRITCFTRNRNSSPSSAFTTTMSSALVGPLEENFVDSSKFPLLIDNTHKQQVSLPLLENSTMANVLVQQQRYRTNNITINASTITQDKDATICMRHSIDERIFFHGSKQWMHFLTRFASEPQISKHHLQTTSINARFIQGTGDFTLSLPMSDKRLIQTENNETSFDDDFLFYCDSIQPVSTSTVLENCTRGATDQIAETTTKSSSEHIIAVNDDVTTSELKETSQVVHVDQDILQETSSVVNENETQCEHYSRRRKQRSSLTKTPASPDDTHQPIVDQIEQLDVNNQQMHIDNNNNDMKHNDLKTQEIHEEKQDMIEAEVETSENKSSKETIETTEISTTMSRYRDRRRRHRFYHHASVVSSSSEEEETVSNIPSEHCLPIEALNVETIKISSIPIVASQSSTSSILSKRSTSSIIRIGSNGSLKKTVTFADDFNRELVQVQYIQSSIDDESKEFSLLLSSSILSSSPPLFPHGRTYAAHLANSEHKPWSFDVVSKSSKKNNIKLCPKRFFCLYRQPNSEHPDIYLHEIWKHQIKLENAEIPVTVCHTGEQQLVGTVWVTNISYSKCVSIKYTFNRWSNIYEQEAHHCRHSNDFRNIDQFKFAVNIPQDVDRIDFVLHYSVNGQEYWDNNEGKNYTLQTESASTMPTTISLPRDCDFSEMRFY